MAYRLYTTRLLYRGKMTVSAERYEVEDEAVNEARVRLRSAMTAFPCVCVVTDIDTGRIVSLRSSSLRFEGLLPDPTD